MLQRTALAIVGLVEFLVPRQVARSLLAPFAENPDDIEFRRGSVTLLRLGGLALLGWALWRSRDELAELPSRAEELTADEHLPEVDVESDEETPTLQPGTTRFDLAAALYQAADPLAVSELVSRSEGTNWEVGRSTVSATLYRMHRDGLVERQEREEGRGFEYWLSETGRDAVEDADAPVETSPTAAEE